MDFWATYITISLAAAVALGGIIKSSPELYEALRPLLGKIHFAAWAAYWGILVGSVLTEHKIRQAVPLTAEIDRTALSQAMPIYLACLLIAATFTAFLLLADAGLRFYAMRSDAARNDRNEADSQPN